MARRDVFRQFLTNLDQPMPLTEKVRKRAANHGLRVALRQTCCGHAFRTRLLNGECTVRYGWSSPLSS